VATSDGVESVKIRSAGGVLAAEFVPGANMVCSSLTREGTELLDPGHGLRAYAERGKTMGIPLLHPWANRLARPGYHAAGANVTLPAPDGRYPTDGELPIHGALPRLLRWELEPESAPDRIGAILDWSSPALLELFPFTHELRYDARLADDRLTVATTLRATGADHVPVSFGYHPYLVLPGARAGCEVALGASERLVLDERMIPTGAREPLADRAFTLGDQSWDDSLGALDPVAQFCVTGGGQTLTMTFEEGYDWAQVYAPPGRDFICFEPMTAPTNALDSGEGLTLVTPGEEYRAVFSITIQ
jgi:galactose mutarotase-like enzyme